MDSELLAGLVEATWEELGADPVRYSNNTVCFYSMEYLRLQFKSMPVPPPLALYQILLFVCHAVLNSSAERGTVRVFLSKTTKYSMNGIGHN